MHYLLSIYFNN